MLGIEIFFTFFNTALSQSSIVAQYPKKNMIKFSQQQISLQLLDPDLTWRFTSTAHWTLPLTKEYENNLHTITPVALTVTGYVPVKFPDLYQFLSKKIHETLASASIHDQHRRKASLKGSIRRSRSSHSRMADGM